MNLILLLSICIILPVKERSLEAALREKVIEITLNFSDSTGISLDVNYHNNSSDTIKIILPPKHHLLTIFPNRNSDSIISDKKVITLSPGKNYKGKVYPFSASATDSIVLKKGKLSTLSGDFAQASLWTIYDSSMVQMIANNGGGNNSSQGVYRTFQVYNYCTGICFHVAAG